MPLAPPLRRLPPILALGLLGAMACLSPAQLELRKQLAYGDYCARQELWREAEYRWKRVLAAEPANVAALNNLGVAALRGERWEEARTFFERALQADPENKAIKRNLKALNWYFAQQTPTPAPTPTEPPR